MNIPNPDNVEDDVEDIVEDVNLETRTTNLETEIKDLQQQIKHLMEKITSYNETLQQSLQPTITSNTVNDDNELTLSELIIKTIVSRIENMLRFTANLYTYILEMAPALIVLLCITKYMLVDF